MKAIMLHEPGGPDVPRHEDGPMAVLGPGQVVVPMAACALNRFDLAGPDETTVLG